MGAFVGRRVFDVIWMREMRVHRREIRLLPMLLFVKGTLWQALFGQEADDLERSSDDPKTCEF